MDIDEFDPEDSEIMHYEPKASEVAIQVPQLSVATRTSIILPCSAANSHRLTSCSCLRKRR